MAARSSRVPSPTRLLGLYALAVMDRDGPVYGYRLAARVAERTSDAWRPGPGAVYPALAALARRGLARSEERRHRRVYRITPQGRAALRRLRSRFLARARLGPDLGILWAEIAGRADAGAFLVERFETHLGRVLTYLTSSTPPSPRQREHLVRVRRSLQAARMRLAAIPVPPRAGERPVRTGGR